MRYLVEFIARENFDPLSAVPVQKMVFTQLDKIMNSGKVKESGVYADERGGFLIMDIESSEELFGLISPIFDAVRIKAHPIVSMQQLQGFFKSYEEMIKKG